MVHFSDLSNIWKSTMNLQKCVKHLDYKLELQDIFQFDLFWMLEIAVKSSNSVVISQTKSTLWLFDDITEGKVAEIIWIFLQFSFVEHDGCFLLCILFSSSRRKHTGSTHNYLLTARNLHQICYLGASFCDIINGS